VVTSLIPQELQSAQYYGSGAYSSEDELVCLSYTWIISALDHLFGNLYFDMQFSLFAVVLLFHCFS
jgi:hypothetical protein